MHIAASAALLILVFGFAGGAWYLWSPIPPAISPAGRFPVIAGLLILIAVSARSLIRERRLPSASELSNPIVWSIGLVIIFLSDFVVRPWGLFTDSFVRGQLIFGVIVFALALCSRWERVLAVWLVVSLVGLAATFLVTAQGMLLTQDDHAMFLFRLKLLKENFPSIPFWSPWWNTGFDARDFFATGSLNAFLLASPLIYLFEVEEVYNYIIMALLWFFVPLCAYCASRVVGAPRSAAVIAAGLSVTTSLLWYRWSLKYGTVGFLTSTALFPLCVALWLRFLTAERPTWRLSLFLLVLTTLMFLWSASGIAFAPIALLALWRAGRLIRSPRHLIVATLLVAVNLPWMAMLWRVSNVGNFLHAESTSSAAQLVHDDSQSGNQEISAIAASIPPAGDFRHRVGSLSSRRAIQELHAQVNAINPLILTYGAPALLCLSGVTRVAFVGLTAWLVFLGTFGVSLKPQLELDRMGLIALSLLVVPIGGFLGQLFERAKQGRWLRCAATLAGSFLIVSPLAVGLIITNKSIEKYRFQNDEMREISRIIAENVGDGRGFFSGCVLHELSGSHVAPIALWTQKPLIASSYAHNIWRYTQPIPRNFLARHYEGITEYLNLMNVSVVLAHEPTWIQLFNDHGSDYRTLYQGPRFTVYKRLNFTPAFTLEGRAHDFVHSSHSLTLVPDSDRVVIKFQYFPFLKSSQCRLQPFPVSAEVTFIELSQCQPGSPVVIEAVTPFERLLGTWGAA
jgi:hypothetical protein